MLQHQHQPDLSTIPGNGGTPGAAVATATAWPGQYTTGDFGANLAGAGAIARGGVAGGSGACAGGGVYPGQQPAGQAWAGAGRGGQGVDAAAQAAANVVTQAAVGFPRQNPMVPIGTSMPAGHPGGSAASQDAAAQEEEGRQKEQRR